MSSLMTGTSTGAPAPLDGSGPRAPSGSLGLRAPGLGPQIGYRFTSPAAAATLHMADGFDISAVRTSNCVSKNPEVFETVLAHLATHGSPDMSVVVPIYTDRNNPTGERLPCDVQLCVTGGIRRSESCKAAAVREAAEETGLVPTCLHHVGRGAFIGTDPVAYDSTVPVVTRFSGRSVVGVEERTVIVVILVPTIDVEALFRTISERSDTSRTTAEAGKLGKERAIMAALGTMPLAAVHERYRLLSSAPAPRRLTPPRSRADMDDDWRGRAGAGAGASGAADVAPARYTPRGRPAPASRGGASASAADRATSWRDGPRQSSPSPSTRSWGAGGPSRR